INSTQTSDPDAPPQSSGGRPISPRSPRDSAGRYDSAPPDPSAPASPACLSLRLTSPPTLLPCADQAIPKPAHDSSRSSLHRQSRNSAPAAPALPPAHDKPNISDSHSAESSAQESSPS